MRRQYSCRLFPQVHQARRVVSIKTQITQRTLFLLQLIDSRPYLLSLRFGCSDFSLEVVYHRLLMPILELANGDRKYNSTARKCQRRLLDPRFPSPHGATHFDDGWWPLSNRLAIADN